VYLGEDEVTDQVSSLKKDLSEPILLGSEAPGLGLENASFKWNEVEEEKAADKKKDTHQSSPSSPNDEASTAVGDTASEISSALLESTDHRFELRDVSVMFPEGELSVITGPTASGKTALLVRAEVRLPTSLLIVCFY
jgi:hypothetical protein